MFLFLAIGESAGKQSGKVDILWVICAIGNLYAKRIRQLLKSCDQTICEDGQNFVLKKTWKTGSILKKLFC